MVRQPVIQSGSMNIAVFAFETRDLNTFPSIINAIRLLSREGHSIDVFLPSSMATDIVIDRCRFFIVSDMDQYEYVSNSVRLVINLGSVYECFFAYYIEGLIVSEILSNEKGMSNRIVYFSMELIYKSYPYRLISHILNPCKFLAGFISSIIGAIRNKNFNRTTAFQLFAAHLKELLFSMLVLRSWWRLSLQGSRVLFSVVSDQMRGAALKEEFPFVNKIVYAPEAGYIGFNNEKSDYAAHNFSIPPGKKILLYTGGFEKGFDLSLLDISRKLSDDYVLLLNVYSRDGYVQEIIPLYSKEIEEGRLLFQTSNLCETDYDELVRSSHVGIVWYPPPNPDNPNMYYLGFSSGKMNKLLSCGKPVICSDGIYGYREMIEGNCLGKICGNANDIILMLDEIEAGYVLMTVNIKKFYLLNLEFESCFKRVMKGLHSYMLMQKYHR